jgi:hypothetical protein
MLDVNIILFILVSLYLSYHSSRSWSAPTLHATLHVAIDRSVRSSRRIMGVVMGGSCGRVDQSDYSNWISTIGELPNHCGG